MSSSTKWDRAAYLDRVGGVEETRSAGRRYEGRYGRRASQGVGPRSRGVERSSHQGRSIAHTPKIVPKGGVASDIRGVVVDDIRGEERIVTVYEPDKDRWSSNFKVRR